MKSSEVAATVAVLPKKTETTGYHVTWKHFAPVIVAIVIALIPAPEACRSMHGTTSPSSSASSSVSCSSRCPGQPSASSASRWSTRARASGSSSAPADSQSPGSTRPTQPLAWALSGFSNTTVWLIFGAFMFALGYEKTGLGRRIALLLVKRWAARRSRWDTRSRSRTCCSRRSRRRTPRAAAARSIRSSATCRRSTIRNPNDPSMRRIGSYIMWVAIATTCVTSSMFLTAPRAQPACGRAGQEDRKCRARMDAIGSSPSPRSAFCCSALVPLLTYWLYPPEVKQGAEVPAWAAKELAEDGAASPREITLGVLVADRAGPVDFRRRHRERDHRRPGRDLLMMLSGLSPGTTSANKQRLEHAGLVRDAGGARRRPEPGRIRQVVRRRGGGPYGRLLADDGS